MFHSLHHYFYNLLLAQNPQWFNFWYQLTRLSSNTSH